MIDLPSFVHKLLPTLQIPLDSVEIQDETLDSLRFHFHLDIEKAVDEIVKLVKQKKSKVVVVSSTLIEIVGNIDFEQDKVVDMVMMRMKIV